MNLLIEALVTAEISNRLRDAARAQRAHRLADARRLQRRADTASLRARRGHALAAAS
jgi:hypothetical protein